jgi:hypothetical protein
MPHVIERDEPRVAAGNRYARDPAR